MPLFNVQIDGSAFYTRRVYIPSADADTAERAYDRVASELPFPVHSTIDRDGDFVVDEAVARLSYAREVRQVANTWNIDLTVKVSVGGAVEIEAEDERHARDSAVRKFPGFPATIDEFWKLDQINYVEATDPELLSAPTF